jgi:DNA-binding IclR family transcriptional regulator
MTKSKLIELTGYNRTTAGRHLAILESQGFLIRDYLNRYALGPKITELARARAEEPLALAIRVNLEALHRETESHAFLFRLDGERLVCIGGAPSKGAQFDVGKSYEPANDAVTLVLIASLNSNRVSFRKFGVEYAQGRFELIRKRGWEYSGANELGSQIAAPVKGVKNDVIAAVVIIPKQGVVSPNRKFRLANAVIATANLLSDEAQRLAHRA